MAARNWTIAEAFKALEGGNIQDRADIGKRYPLFATASVEDVMEALTFVTVRKVETVLRDGTDIIDDEGDE